MICLCGLPASGKSTFLVRFLKEHSCTSVQFDSFLLKGRYQEGREKFREKVVESLKARPQYLLIEHTFQHRSSRDWVVQLSKQYFVACVFVYFNIPLEQCIDRDQTRENQVGEQSIRNVASEFDEFLKEPVIEIGDNFAFDCLCREVIAFLAVEEERLDTLRKQEAESEKERQEYMTSSHQLHEFDIQSRRILGEYILRDESKALALNTIRRARLREVKEPFSLELELQRLRQLFDTQLE